ncbi:MAG: hypothetical protein WA863_13945 [Methyloceanibacter sp.]
MAKVLTEDEARRIASNIAKLRTLLDKGDSSVGFGRRPDSSLGLDKTLLLHARDVCWVCSISKAPAITPSLATN